MELRIRFVDDRTGAVLTGRHVDPRILARKGSWNEEDQCFVFDNVAPFAAMVRVRMKHGGSDLDVPLDIAREAEAKPTIEVTLRLKG